MDTEAVKKELIERRFIILKRVEKLNSDKKREKGPLEQDLSEQATAIENDEVIDALDEVERHELDHIQRALEQIEQGNYGTCVECGESISAARLRALPYAVLCIKCADDQEV